jgi:hypothetical protein
VPGKDSTAEALNALFNLSQDTADFGEIAVAEMG